MDKKLTGEIGFEEYSKAWKITKASDVAVAKRIFAFMDKDKAHGDTDVLHFQEWAVMTYDFCTLREEGVVQWTFSLFDADQNRRLSVEEFKEMARVTLG